MNPLRVLLPVISSAALFLALGQAASAEANRPRTEPVSLKGTWIGVYQVYPNYVQLSLTIAGEPDGNGDATAELRVEGLSGGNAPHRGVSAGRIRYESYARSLDISATGNALGQVRFHAVYDAERRVFAGYRINAASDASPYFLLVRQGQEGKFFDRIRDMPNGKGRRPALGLGSSPSADVLRKWASQIYQDYPELKPFHTEMGSLYLIARNLFRDEFFQPFFGRNYDALSNADLARIYRKLGDLPPPRANFPEDSGNGAARPLDRGFWVNTGTFGAPDLMLSVPALRSISAWIAQTRQRLGQIQDPETAFRTLNLLEAETTGVLATLWPRERETFTQALNGRRSELADPVLIAKVQNFLESANGFNHVATLQQTNAILTAIPSAAANARTAPTVNRRAVLGPPSTANLRAGEDLPSLARLASEPVRVRLRSHLAQTISSLVSAEVERDLGRIRFTPANPAGDQAELQETARLQQQLQAKYAGFVSDRTVPKLFEELAARRALALQTARPRIELLIEQAGTEAALDDIAARHLNVPSDRTDAVGRGLVASLQSKKNEFRLARQKAEAARQEAELAQQTFLQNRATSVVKRRQTLTQQLGVRPITFDELQEVLRVVPLIKARTPESDEQFFLAVAQRLGFSHVSEEVFLDINRFRDAHDRELTTYRIQSPDRATFYVVTLILKNPERALVELYAAELVAEYRDMRRSTVDSSEREPEVPANSRDYIKSGGTIYYYKTENGALHVSVMSNADASAAVVAERTGADTVRVSSYSRTTDIKLRKGDRLRLTASGKVTLGIFAGESGPNGIRGFEPDRRDARFPIGALLGQFGEGAWFLVGSQHTVLAPETGSLSLRINDGEPGNNDGAYDVAYSIESGSR